MILGNKTINYNIYDRTNGKPEILSDTTSYQRPAIENLTDKLSGAGIMGEIDMPSLAQIGSLSGEIALKRTNAKAAELFSPKAHDIEIRWATDVIDSATGKVTVVANKDIIRFYPKSLDAGKVESNSTNDGKLSMEIIYFNHISNGVSFMEIDKLNNVLKIMGVDYASAIREAL